MGWCVPVALDSAEVCQVSDVARGSPLLRIGLLGTILRKGHVPLPVSGKARTASLVQTEFGTGVENHTVRTEPTVLCCCCVSEAKAHILVVEGPETQKPDNHRLPSGVSCAQGTCQGYCLSLFQSLLNKCIVLATSQGRICAGFHPCEW